MVKFGADGTHMTQKGISLRALNFCRNFCRAISLPLAFLQHVLYNRKRKERSNFNPSYKKQKEEKTDETSARFAAAAAGN